MIPEWNYPTAFSRWGDAEYAAIERVTMSGRFTIGPEVKAFETEFAAWHNMRFGVMVNSGSSANLIAVAALAQTGRIKRGQKVLVPAIAWSTTYAPLVQYGLDLVLMDVDESWNADPYHKKFDPPKDTGLVVGCSILGNPAHMRALQDIASVLEVPLLEDNCESLGARDDHNQLCGTFGNLTTSSFFYSHQINGIEGGMILTDDEDLANVCRMLRAHGWTRDVAAPKAFEEEYDFRMMGYNVRPLEMNAAVARAQLRDVGDFIKARVANADYFRRRCKSLMAAGVLLPQVPTSSETSPFGLSFEIAPPGARKGVVEALRRAGIDARLPTGGSLRRHAYGAPWASQETPRADLIHDRGLFLGNAPWNIESLIDEAVEIMEGVLL